MWLGKGVCPGWIQARQRSGLQRRASQPRRPRRPWCSWDRQDRLQHGELRLIEGPRRTPAPPFEGQDICSASREADQTFGRTRRGAQLRTQYKCAIQSAAARPELPGGVRDPHRLTGPDQGGGGRAEEVGQHGGEQAGRGNRGRPAGCDCLLRRVCQARKRGWPILQQLLDRAASFGSSSDSRQKRPEIRMAGIGPASVSRVANVKVCIARFPDMIWSIEWRGSVLAGTLWGYKLLRSRQIPRNPDRLP